MDSSAEALHKKKKTPVRCEKWTGVKEIDNLKTNKLIIMKEYFKATGRGVVISDIVRFYPTGTFCFNARLWGG